MKARDQFKSLFGAALAAVLVFLGAAGMARAADPTVSFTSSPSGIDEDQTSRPFQFININDTDAGDTVTVTITFPDNDGTFAETVDFTQTGAGTYVLSSRSPANAQTFLRSVSATFTPNRNRIPDGTTGTTTFTVVAEDASGGSATNSVDLDITGINDPPSVSFGSPNALAIFDNQSGTPFSQIDISDSDVGDTVTTLITFTEERGALVTGGGLTKTGPGTYALDALSPTMARAFLRALVFTPASNRIPVGTFENTIFTVRVEDGAGAFDAATVSQRVNPFNDAPRILNAGASFASGDNETSRPFVGVQIVDVDNRGTQTVTLTVTITLPARGNFTNGTLLPFTPLGGGAYSVIGAPAAVAMALTNLVFKPRENFVPVGLTETTEFRILVSDDGAPSLSDLDTNKLTATSINDVPDVGGVAAAARAVRTGSAIQPFASVIISDPDVGPSGPPSFQSQTVQVTLTGASVAGQFNPPGGNATTFTLANVTPSEATLAIEGLTYVAPTFPLPLGVTNRMRANITVTDAASGVRINTNTLLDLYSLYTPPGLTGMRADQRVNDTDTVAPFSSVSIQSLNGGTFAVQVQLDNDAKGQLINLAGFVKTAGPRARYTFTGTSEAATLAIRQLLFQPVENRLNGSATETVVFDIALIDGGATNGPDSSTTVIVSPVNDRPLIQGIPPLIRITDNETTQPFRTVSISDVDERGTQSVRVTITLDDPAKGSFDSNRLGGFVASVGGIHFTGTPAAATLAMSNLLFAPTENRVPIGQAETTVFTIAVDDQHGGAAFNGATSVRVSSVAGAPEITVPQPQPISRPFTPPILPFESVMITDEEDLTVTVTVLNTNQGTFLSNTLAATGFTNAGSGHVIFHGTVDAVSNAITHLEFSPNTNLPPGVVNFSITAVDATGNVVTESLSMQLRASQRTFLVTKTGDYDSGETDPDKILGTLRKTIEDAGSNDHVTFCLRPPTNGVPEFPATIRLRRTLTLNKNVTLDGPGAALLTISGDRDNNGAATVQLFEIFAHATFNRVTLAKGGAGFAGGAVSVKPGGHLTLSYCTVSECEAEQWGGGIDVDGGSLSADHSLIVSNRTSAAVGQGGGGISLYTDQDCVIENTTISGNQQRSAGGLGGGGLYVENRDPGHPLVVSINGCTFKNNTDAANGGTSIRPNVFNAQVLLKDTLVADGQGRNLETDGSGLITSGGGNVSDDGTRTIFSFGGNPFEVVVLVGPGDRVSTDPLLQSLANNSGPTRTHALNAASVALSNTVTADLGTDQRGFWRDAAPDSGAFESGAFKQIIINEIHFDPVPDTNDEFIEFYVPRYSATQNLAGFTVCIGGVLRHTFTSQVLGPGQALVLFSKDATSTTVPPGVFKQVSTTNLLLDNSAGTITIKDPLGRVVFEVEYVGSYTATDPAETNLLQAHQSITLVPEFTGVFLPFQRAYKKIIGADPSPAIVSSPGQDVSGASLAGGNKPPVAFDDYTTTDEDTALTIPVLANDLELDRPDSLRVTGVSSPSAFNATVATDGTNVVYDPTASTILRSLPAGSNRVDTITYTIIDCCDPLTGLDWPATGSKYTATNYVTVLGVNDAPTPQPDSGVTNPVLRTREDQPLDINVVVNLLPNDTDPDTDDDNTTLQIASVHQASAHEDTFEAFSSLGALVMLELRFNRNETHVIYDPSVSATLNALSQGETANDTFYYSVIDSHGAIGVAQVTIVVTGTNDAPTANADLLATDEDTVLTVPVTSILGNDSDPDTDDNMTTLATLTISALNGSTSLVATSAFGARVSIQGANLVYDPTISSNLNALSRKEMLVDSFTYTTDDGSGGRSTAAASVTVTGVNDQPVTAGDTLTVDEDTPKTVAAPGVLANDIDFDVNGAPPDDVLRVIPVVSGHTIRGASYTENSDGSFSFDPRGVFDYLKQGATTNDTFTYTAVDDSYTIANDDQFSVLADSTNVVLSVLVNDVTLTGTGGSLRITNVAAPDSGGTVSIDGSGTALVYTPQISFVGVETFQYAIKDGQGGHDTATVRVKVTVPVLNGRLTANADKFTVARGTTVNLDALANDNILPGGGDVLTIVALGSADQGGAATINGAGQNNSITYSPSPAPALPYPYTETLTYAISGGGLALATGSVMITVVDRQGVLPVNDDVFTVIAGGSNNSLDVLANDRVVPGTTTNLTITAIRTNGVSGTVSINAAGSRLLYTPPAGAPSLAEATFFYVISDGSGGSATGAVLVTVLQQGLNANADFCTVARNSTNALLVLANDNALPNTGQNLLITTIGLGTNAPNHGGRVTVSPTGKSLIYSPSPTNLTGEETFTYEMTDGTLARAQARVKIKILDRDGAVNMNPDVFSVGRDSANNVLRVLGNDNVRPDTRERLTITALSAANHGGVARLAGSVPNQVVLYDAPSGFVGDETFTYSVADNRGGTATASVTVRVGYLATQDDLFTVLSDSSANALDVLANDRLLPNGTPGRPLWALGPTDHGGIVQTNAARDGALYTPAPGFVGRETFTYQVADDTGNIEAGRVTVSVLPAGEDRDTATVTVTIIGVNDLPTIVGATNNLAITDKQTIQPFAGVTIGDVDEYGLQPLTVTVILDDAAKGVLLNLGGFVAGIGTYTFHGTGPEVTAAIRGLVFDPTENRITVPTTETTRFTILANDGLVTVTNNNAAVDVTAVNDPPTIAGAVAGQTVYHRLTIRPFASVTISEVDDLRLQPLRVTVSLNPTNGYLTSLGGFALTGAGIYTLTNVSAAVATATLRGLIFVPTTGNRVGPGASETTRLTLSVNDGFAPPVIDDTTTVIALNGFVKKVFARDGTREDEFGYAVSTTRDLVAVGVPMDDPDGSKSGAVYLFARNAGGPEQWGQIKKLVAFDAASSDRFGYAVGLSGDTLVVGAPEDSHSGKESGSAYIYERNRGGPDQWGLARKIVGADRESGDDFGQSVGISGDTIVIGAAEHPHDGIDAGSAYIFQRDAGGPGNWGQTKELFPADGADDDEFGFAVAIDRDTIVIGARYDHNHGSSSGSAYVFERNQGGAGAWGQARKLLAADGASSDEFGRAVAISGDLILVGAPYDSDNGKSSGSAYVFARNSGGTNVWGQVRKLLPFDAADSDRFGWAAAIDRELLAVGARKDDDNGSRSGSAYVFARNHPGLAQWSLLEKIVPPDGDKYAEFGFAVSLAQNTLAIGARKDDDNGDRFGSTYIYRLKFNNGPVVLNPLADQMVALNMAFSFTIPANTFADRDGGDAVTLSASVAGPDPAPAWLSFDPVMGALSGVPDTTGSYPILITATDQDGASATSGFNLVVAVSAPLPHTALDAWRRQNFDAASLADPGQEAALWGDAADPDRDGLSNLQEYLFGSAPLVAADYGNRSVLKIVKEEGTQRLALHFRRRLDDPRRVYLLQASTDLANWISAGGQIETESTAAVDGEIESVTVYLQTPSPVEERQFFRIKVEH